MKGGKRNNANPKNKTTKRKGKKHGMEALEGGGLCERPNKNNKKAQTFKEQPMKCHVSGFHHDARSDKKTEVMNVKKEGGFIICFMPQHE